MRWDFWHKKEPLPQAPTPTVDLHSHLIPGIDDGSGSMEESLTLLRHMERLGYEKIITTPHVMVDIYRNTSAGIKEGLVALQAAARSEGIKITIEAGAEYYLDEGFYSHLESGEVMAIQGTYVLFETSHIAKPLQLEEMIFEIASQGYTPLLAHPERYRYIQDPQQEYGRLKELGVLFQIDLNSLGGYYGKSAKKRVEFLSREGMVDFVGSDLHSYRHIEELAKVLHSTAYQRLCASNTIRNDALR